MKNILLFHIDAFRSDLRDLIIEKENTDLKGFKYLDENYSKLHNCYSQATSTIYSVAGYLTGTYPFINTVVNNDTGTVPNNIKFIGEYLKEIGYHSKGFITNGPKHVPNFQRMGIHRCFDEVEFLHSKEGFLEDQYPSKMLADNYGKDIIGRCNEGDKYFTYVTLLDMHVWNGRHIDGDWDEYYKEGCLQVDYFLKEILPKIDLEKCSVIVLGDHGFKFKFDQEERNTYYSFDLEPSGYEPLIKVGCYISDLSYPIHSRTRLVDILPTILDFIDHRLVTNNKFCGRSLSSSTVVREEVLYKDIVYSEIGMTENPKRKIDIEGYYEFIKKYPTPVNMTKEESLETLLIPEKHNFSLMFSRYQIMFGMNGIPYGLFEIKNNKINYSKNLIHKKAEVEDYCKRSEKFINHYLNKFQL